MRLPARLWLFLGAFGLLMGVLAAIAQHLTPVGTFAWFAYIPLRGASGGGGPVRPQWWPTLLVYPAGGLVVGGAVGRFLDLAATAWFARVVDRWSAPGRVRRHKG